MFVKLYVMPTKIILASASPRREELLRSMRIPFESVPPNVSEKEDTDGDPVRVVIHNAQLKADDVFKRFPNEVILAADTVVVLGKEILHKPKHLADARSMLGRLSNSIHRVYTGICLRYAPQTIDIAHSEVSEVRFRQLNDSIIDDYLSKVNCLDKAGAYAIQEYPELLIAGYKGHMSNIMGLPVEFVYSLLKKLNLLSRE